MAIRESVHALYLARGRLALAEQRDLQHALDQVQAGLTQPDAPSLVWTLVSSQKKALQAGRRSPPSIAVVEFDEGVRRMAFCSQLLHRWPTTRLIAVANTPLENAPVTFEQAIPYPMQPEALQQALKEIWIGAKNGALVQAGEVTLDLQNRIVMTPRGHHHMTPKQCALLNLLMARRNEVVSRSEIMRKIWQTDFLGDTRTLDVHVRWLREYIESDPSSPKRLITVRGKGYRFCVDD
ncbi:MAG: winged helix-turn-helix domain-containing protein [Caldilinea sp.]|nr:winged helix-turn-helix domain-containing protein [Caldilinea sp.]MDW8440722.1 winged helix-turn-helix domain-containing protein [Caldilineaceae bacterium]